MDTNGPATWRIRINAPSGAVAGSGVLIDRLTVLTCAEVVNRALAGTRHERVSGDVAIDFPGSIWHVPHDSGITRADGWATADGHPGRDLALLTLTAPVPGDVHPASLAPCGQASAREVSFYGYPPGLDHGAWSRAHVIPGEERRPWWVLVDGEGPGTVAVRGFAGAGVLDASGAVIGVVGAGDRTPAAGCACLIPTETWATQLPALDGLVDRAHAGGTGQPAPAVVRHLVAALQEVPAMREASARHHVIQGLRAEIAGITRRYASASLDIHALVRTCLDYPGGLAELMGSVRALTGEGSESLHRVEQLIIEYGLSNR